MSAGLSVIQEAALARLRQLGLPQGGQVLDVPCGAGRLTAALQQLGLRAVGVDLLPEARRLLGDAFREADLAGALPFADSDFDCVVSTEGIEHLENPFHFLREVGRVLRPGGVLVLTTPNTVGIRSRVRFLGSGFFHHDPRPLRETRRDPLHHIGLRTFTELRYLLVVSGFSLCAATHTHIKPISLLYALFVPWMALYTRVAFRKEKDAAQRRINRDIRRTLLSGSLLFGENLLLIATRQSESPPPAA